MLDSPEMPSPISVLVIDDQRAVLAGVRALVDGEAPTMRVTGLARTGHEAIELARLTRPRVIILDLELGAENGLELVEALRAASGAEFVVLSSSISRETRQRALALGVTRFVLKSAPGETLITTIHSAVEHSSTQPIAPASQPDRDHSPAA